MAISQPAQLSPAPWMCFRTWLAANGDSRSLLRDERHHHVAVLEGPSSHLWGLIERGCSLPDLRACAARLGVADELDEFLESLRTQGFLTDAKDSEGASADPAPEPLQLEHAENTPIEHEVQYWCEQHGFLFSVHWEVTYRCNERCVHCYNPGAAHLPGERPERQTAELTTDEAVSMLDDMRAAGVSTLTLSGGEVMLRHDFWELVAAARTRGFSVRIYTNGLKLDEAACRRLAALWPSSVSISVYSADAAAHDAITCVPGSFARSVRALESLRALGIKTFLKSLQMSHTLIGYARVRELADQLGAGAEIEVGMSPGADGAQAPLALAACNPEELVVLAASPSSPLFVGDASTNWGRVEKDRDATVCGAGRGALGVDPTGGINACNSMPIPAGSHRTHGFLNVWRASRTGRRLDEHNMPAPDLAAAVAPLSRWQEIVLKDYHECGTHRRCGWCQKCPGTAMLEHGDPLAPSTTNCRTATARMTAADLLQHGLTRDEIALHLGVPLDFGQMAARTLRRGRETMRGTGFDPVGVALGVLQSKSPSPLVKVALLGADGQPELHAGTCATAEALSSFHGLGARASHARTAGCTGCPSAKGQADAHA